MLKSAEDGITHINIYSKGKTELGRFLSNFTYAPFEHPTDGKFASIEGYWYWLSTKDDKLRTLSGFKAKQYGRIIKGKDWCNEGYFKLNICLAINIKIENNPNMLKLLKESTLPLKHYYIYSGKIIEPKEGKWILDYINEYRETIKK